MKLGCQHKGHKGCAGWLLVGALNQKKTLEGALSVIEKRDGLFAALITTSSSHLYGEARLLEELLGLGAGYDAVRAGLHPAELRHVVAQLLPRDLPDAAPIRAQYRDGRQPIRGQYYSHQPIRGQYSPGLALALVLARAPVAALLLCAQQLQAEYLVYLLCEATIIVLGVF